MALLPESVFYLKHTAMDSHHLSTFSGWGAPTHGQQLWPGLPAYSPIDQLTQPEHDESANELSSAAGAAYSLQSMGSEPPLDEVTLELPLDADDTDPMPDLLHPLADEPLRCQLSSVLRVSRHTPVNSLAGAVTKRLRAHEEVSIEALGATSVTNVLLALQCAARFMKDDPADIRLHTEFMAAEVGGGGKSHPGLRFAVGLGVIPAGRSREQVHVRDDATTGRAAGAIAKVARICTRKGVPFGISFGPSTTSCNTAAKALALGRTMVQEESIDVQLFVPWSDRELHFDCVAVARTKVCHTAPPVAYMQS
eukprot:TRINITY_DN467_c3_g1_i2.p1 TRINITY_DN467_c3_g1~~TRINITY_DN467_c3_g1_i2.p1  ORF type:complete len:309 (+),score=100.66 TRINITY_DN467_c3_g1_i2:534-1460(+)